MAGKQYMKLLVFATYLEAEATIQRLHAKENALNMFSFEGGAILLSGMGSHAAIAAILERGREFDEIWNLGFAGSLTHAPLFRILSIGKVIKHVPTSLDSYSLEIMNKAFPPLHLEGESTLLTSDFPLHQKPFDRAALVDMEGYGMAFAANHLGKKCRMWKIVSDFVSQGGAALIQQNAKKLSKLLADKIEHELCFSKKVNLSR